jgi:hypothetical protein
MYSHRSRRREWIVFIFLFFVSVDIGIDISFKRTVQHRRRLGILMLMKLTWPVPVA